MPAIEVAGNDSGLPILVLADVDQVTCFPVSISLIADLPKFGSAVIVSYPVCREMGGGRYRVGAGAITRIAVVHRNNAFAIGLRQQVVIIAERQRPGGGIATVPIAGRRCGPAGIK